MCIVWALLDVAVQSVLTVLRFRNLFAAEESVTHARFARGTIRGLGEGSYTKGYYRDRVRVEEGASASHLG